MANLLDDFWDAGVLVEPARKQAISLRIDEDVLMWFKEAGPRYQSKMNAVLRSYMNARQGVNPGVEPSSLRLMNIRPIRTDEDHAAALRRIDALMDAEPDSLGGE